MGFVAGAAIVIGLQQLKGLLGISHFTNKTDIISVVEVVHHHVVLGGGQDASAVTTTDHHASKFEAKFYDKILQEEIGGVKGHFGPINAFAFNPYGKSCASEKEVRSSTEFHDPLNFLILTLLGVLGASFRGSSISPLKEHGEIMFFIIMAIVIYCIAFLGMKLGPQNATYLPMFKFICVTCALLACELFASILIDPLRLFIINLCGILVELIRRSWYKLIYQLLSHATNNLVHWIQHISQTFNKYFGTKKQDQDDIV